MGVRPPSSDSNEGPDVIEFGIAEVAAELDEPITVFTSRHDLYEQYTEWCNDHGLDSYTLPSFYESCPTAKGEHGDRWRNQVLGLHNAGATASEIHERARQQFGEPLPCEQGSSCPYKAKWDFEPTEYDVLVGVNLLREGLDIPEVSLVAILDADQEGFLRSETTLVQTMGRAARNVNGEVVLYADDVSDAMQRAIDETNRRRRIQEEYNEEHGFEPQTIEKEVGESSLPGSKTETGGASSLDPADGEEAARAIEHLEERMQEAADNLEFELAADIRDRIRELRERFDELDAPEEGVPAPDEPP